VLRLQKMPQVAFSLSLLFVHIRAVEYFAVKSSIAYL